MPEPDDDPHDRTDEERDDDPVDVPIDEGDDESIAPNDGDGTGGADGEDRANDRRAEDAHRDDEDRDDTTVDVSTPGTGSGAADPDARRDASGERAGDESEHWLSSLLSALESLDDGSTSGRRRSDRTVVDYDVSIGTAADRFEGVGTTDADRDADRADPGRSRRRRTRSTPSSDHHLTVRRYEDELLVTADVAGVDPDEVTVGFDDATLVVGVSGSELGRTDVPWDERTADATISNGVLTVQILPEDDGGAGGDDA